jgi:hypothetical protein
VADSADRHFFFGPVGFRFHAPLDALQATVAPALVTHATAFRHNLLSVVETARLPHSLVYVGVASRHFSRVLIAERIRARADSNSDEAKRELDATTRAQAQFDEMLEQKEFQDSMEKETESNLTNIHEVDTEVAGAARELLRQAASLTWAALEILMRDMFVTVLNEKPELVKILFDDPVAKRALDLKPLSYEIFEEYGFDLSKRMGDVLLKERRLDSLPGIKSVLKALVGDPELIDALGSPELWLLNQRRHLIVHRRGIVDAEYVAKTGDALPIGSQLEITPDNLRGYLSVVRDTGVLGLQASTRRMT